MQVVGDDIANAAGVAITFTMKAGLGLSGMTGRGFVLRKVIAWEAHVIKKRTTLQQLHHALAALQHTLQIFQTTCDPGMCNCAAMHFTVECIAAAAERLHVRRRHHVDRPAVLQCPRCWPWFDARLCNGRLAPSG